MQGFAAGDHNRWAAYSTAILRMDTPAGSIVVSPEASHRTDGHYPDPAGRPIAVITACNPGGRKLDDTANAAAQAKLEAELRARRISWWPAAGSGPAWTHVEASAAIVGISEAEAMTIGLAHGQDAIFFLTPTARDVVDCATGERLRTGWSIQEQAPRAIE